jgi:hypothetical protein
MENDFADRLVRENQKAHDAAEHCVSPSLQSPIKVFLLLYDHSDMLRAEVARQARIELTND